MTLTIHCDHVDPDFRRCEAELSGMAFNAKPRGWRVVDLGAGDHLDYCFEHAALLPPQPDRPLPPPRGP